MSVTQANGKITTSGQTYSELNSAISNLNKRVSESMWQLDQMQNNATLNMMYAYNAQQQADKFNATEAQKQRDWSEQMSATAHQREVEDLKKAGLNPVLSAGSTGASVGSGAAASSTNTLTGVYGQLATQAMNAVQTLSSALLANQTSFTNATISQNATKYASDQSLMGSLYGANSSFDAAKYASDVSYKASKYASDKSYNASIYASKVSKYAADLSSKTSLSINQATLKLQDDIAVLNSLTSLRISEISRQTSIDVARIGGEYSLSAAQISSFASQYAAELAYDAQMYAADLARNTQLTQTQLNNSTTMKAAKLNNETSHLNTQWSTIGSLISSILGVVVRH